MPKSSSFTSPALGDEDVGRLEVAMHHEVLVGVLHRVADLAEECEATARCFSARAVAVGVDRCSVDVLHDVVRQAVVRDAAVEQARDVGMVEAGEDVSLAAEPLGEEADVAGVTHHLERDASLEGAVGALGLVTAPMPPVPATRTDLPGTTRVPGASGAPGRVRVATSMATTRRAARRRESRRAIRGRGPRAGRITGTGVVDGAARDHHPRDRAPISTTARARCQRSVDSVTERHQQPALRLEPVAVHGATGHAHDRGRLLLRESPEEAVLDHPLQPLVDLRRAGRGRRAPQ